MSDAKDKWLVMVFKERGAKEFIDYVQKARSGKEEIVIICSNNEISRNLSDFGHDCKTIASYSQDISVELKNATAWMNAWPDKPLSNGKSFKELLVHEGVSIYWFLQTRFYLRRIRDLIILIERIERIIHTENPSKIWVKGNHDVRFIISNMYKGDINGGMMAAHKRSNEDEGADGKVRYKSYQGYPTLKLLVLKILRGTFVSSSRSKKNSGTSRDYSKGRVLVVTEVSSWRREFDYELQRYEMRDVFFHGITKRLSELGYDVIIVDFENRPKQLLKAYAINKKRRAGFGGLPVMPWEMYVNFETVLKSMHAKKRYAKLWRQLQNSADFVKSLTYKNVPIYQLIRNDIEDLLNSLKAYAAVTFIETARRIIEVEKPSVVVMHDEYGALQLSIINAAKEKGIPTVSLQHGLVSEEQISYVHAQEHITGERRGLLFPVPDRMCVWSETAGQNLIEIAKFPPSAPVVTGDPKVDFLPKAMALFNHDRIVEKLGIQGGKKIVVFATENLPSEQEKSLVTKNVLKAINTIPECHLMIKMHPNETDIAYYDKSAKEAGLQNYSIVRDVNLYELLYVSSLVILSYSTVAVEAMRMERPVIALDLMGLHDNVSFIKNRKAIVISNPDDLPSWIQKCLDGSEIQGMVKEGKAFAEQELGVADGRASERVARLVADMSLRYTQGSGA